MDLDMLACWMDGRGLGLGPIAAPRLLAGGTQNLILSFSRGGRGFVLRRPALYPRPAAKETMRARCASSPRLPVRTCRTRT